MKLYVSFMSYCPVTIQQFHLVHCVTFSVHETIIFIPGMDRQLTFAEAICRPQLFVYF
jgi:hypothetical protein